MRVPELDGIRGLACLLVVIWHYFFAPINIVAGSRFADVKPLIAFIGVSGVDLFFVLSGFLIGGILIDHRDTPHYLRTFYTRRVSRIFPLYYFILFCMVVLLASGLPERFPAYNKWLFMDLMPLWSYATFTQNFFMGMAGTFGGLFIAMTWSVAIEEHFYLTFPLFTRHVNRRTLVICCMLSPLICMLMRYFFRSQELFYWQYTLPICRFDGLALGVLAACAVRSQEIVEVLRSKRWLFLGVIVITMIIMFLLYKNRVVKNSLLSLFYAECILYSVLNTDSFAAYIFRFRWLRFLGVISYGLYMYHQPINGLLQGAFLDRIPTCNSAQDVFIAFCVLIIALAISSASYFLVERRFLAIGRKVPVSSS